MRQMANREIARRKEIEDMLDYMYRQLEQLAVVNNLPNVVDPSKALLNRSLDVKSAVLVYLSVHIRHEGELGIIGMSTVSLLEAYPEGNVAKAFFKGNKECDDSRTGLEKAVQEFNSSLSNFGHSIDFETFALVKGMSVALLI
jgi:hypothetical protein